MKKIRIGIVGAGSISGIYFKNLSNLFREVEIAGVCDLIRERAEKAVNEWKLPRLYEDMYELFADPEVDLVLNITRPHQHFGVSKAALEAGKHVYSEKPLAASLDEGLELVRLAESKGLMLGGAPDTFMGAGIQTCRRLIDDGYIGRPLGASAFMAGHGPESWHPDPDFFYQYGGGPMFDMGPYYITAMINLLGGIEGVTGVAKKSFEERTATCAQHFGEKIEVNVSTYIAGVMRFKSGAVGTLFTTFDVYPNNLPRIEIYGSEGTLSVPDPNTFGGPIKLYRPQDGAFKEMPLCFPYKENSRGLGLCDMAKTIAAGGEKFRACRTTWRQTLHVLETMESFQTASDTGRYVQLTSKFEREAPCDPEFAYGILD